MSTPDSQNDTATEVSPPHNADLAGNAREHTEHADDTTHDEGQTDVMGGPDEPEAVVDVMGRPSQPSPSTDVMAPQESDEQAGS